MRKILVTFCLVIIYLLSFPGLLMAADIINANYGSVVIRDYTVAPLGNVGHAGVVIMPLFGNDPDPNDAFIAQANGYFVMTGALSSSLVPCNI